MKLPKLLVGSICFCFVLTLFFAVYIYKTRENSDTLVYVDSQKVFEKFKMTHDVKLIGDKTLDERSRTIDSLYAELNNPDNVSLKDILMQKIIFQKDALEEFNAHFTSEHTEKIWKRIRVYADEFAKEHDYKYVLGAQPNYNIIFGHEESDKTEEFLQFINNKYEDTK